MLQPFTIDAKVYGDIMDKYFRLARVRGLTRACSAEEFFPFHYNHVATLHYHKQGFGSGLWFRLRDGRVFDAQARPAEPDPAFYDATTH